jgi:hypothetical protein
MCSFVICGIHCRLKLSHPVRGALVATLCQRCLLPLLARHAARLMLMHAAHMTVRSALLHCSCCKLFSLCIVIECNHAGKVHEFDVHIAVVSLEQISDGSLPCAGYAAAAAARSVGNTAEGAPTLRDALE